MVLRTAGRGRYEGQQFWGCSTFPQCRARVEIASETPPPDGWAVSPAGASAEAEYQRRQQRNRDRIRRQWPYALAFGVVVCVLAFSLVNALTHQLSLALFVAGALAITQLVGFLEASTVWAWRVGAEGERRTAASLEPLREKGFVVLHDRKVKGWGGNLDHVVIGPTGMWAVETKNIAGKVVIRGDVLRIGGHRRDKIIDQAKQEATIIQVVLADKLDSLKLRVTPVICLHRGELPFFNKTVRGVRLASGRQLVRLLQEGDVRLTPDQVQGLARAADAVLRPAVS